MWSAWQRDSYYRSKDSFVWFVLYAVFFSLNSGSRLTGMSDKRIELRPTDRPTRNVEQCAANHFDSYSTKTFPSSLSPHCS